MTNLTLPGFTVIEQLPRGASGLIYRVRDFGGRYYVLKLFCPIVLATVPNPDGTLCLKPDQHETVLRQYALFRREAAVSQELYAEYGGATNSCYFYRGDFVELCDLTEERVGAYILYDTSSGESLSALLRRRQPHLDPEGALLCAEWTRRLLEALRQMHGHRGPEGERAPYLHLDVKCSNIYATDMAAGGDEALRVFRMLDLGSALPLGDSPRDRELRRSLGKSLSTTEGYAAPELLEAMRTGDTSALSERTDVYSVAAVLFTMLAGHPYDYDSLDIRTPCVTALPAAARRQLRDLLRTCLETRERMSPSQLYEALGALTDTIRRRGLSHAVLFEGARRFAGGLAEKPDERLLARVKLRSQSYDHFAQAMDSGASRVCLVGSGMMGKTFSMLHCVCRLTEAYDPEGAVPLYVPLRSLKNRTGRMLLTDYIVNRYGGETRGDHAFALRESLRQGHFLLLIDGLNELSGDEALPGVLSELREFMELGVRVAVSSQSDPRTDLLAGSGLELCEPQALTPERIGRYLAVHHLPEAGGELLNTLSRPMLLKMYALSERGVIDGDYLNNRRLRFIPQAKKPAEIMLNYREYRLAQYLNGPRFDEACVLLRLFLPFLAYEFCADERITLHAPSLNSELDAFFTEARKGPYLREIMACGDPRFVAPEEYKAIDDFNRDPARVLNVSLAANGIYDLTNADLHKLFGEFTDDLDIREIRELLSLPEAENLTEDLRLAGRRDALCIQLLRACGLLSWQDGDVTFIHDELKYVFCAEFLALHRKGSADQLRAAFGRYSFCDRVIAYAAQLFDPAPALDALRGEFDYLDSTVLGLLDPEKTIIQTAPLFSETGVCNLIALDLFDGFIRETGWAPDVESGIRAFGLQRLHTILDRLFFGSAQDQDSGDSPEPAPGVPDHLLPPDLPGLEPDVLQHILDVLTDDSPELTQDSGDSAEPLRRGDHLTEEDQALLHHLEEMQEQLYESSSIIPNDVLPLPPMLRLSIFTRVTALPGDMTSPVSPAGYLEQRRLAQGGASTAVANLLRMLESAGHLAGADLRRLDLSGAELSAMDLRRCDMRGARLNMNRLRGFLCSGTAEGEGRPASRSISGVRHMAYSASGRYLYLLSGWQLRAFDMFEQVCIFEYELEDKAAWFWLNDNNDVICLADRSGYIQWVDAYTGSMQASFQVLDENNDPPTNIARILDADDTLLVEERRGRQSRVAVIHFDADGHAEYEPWKEGCRIKDSCRQNRREGADYTVRLRLRPNTLPMGYLIQYGDGSSRTVGRAGVLYLGCAVSPGTGRIAMCTATGIEEYDFYSGEPICTLSGVSTARLTGADLRGVFPALDEDEKSYAAALGAVTD